jgi:membrane-associated phospholipid phosphatase
MDNYTLHYPFAVHERIPVFQLCLICVAAPAVIIAIYTLVIDGLFSHQTAMPANSSGVRRLSGRYRLKDRLWELNCGILGLGLSVCAAFTITGALKNAIGKPRPDLIDRCKVKPDWEKPENAVGTEPWLLYTIKICTQGDNAILQDGFKSFPSGHSSSTSMCLYLIMTFADAT